MADTTVKLRVDDRLWLAGERLPYTVQAVSECGRWVAATKPFAAQRTVLYTLIDTERMLRGVDDSIGNSLGYETRAECEEAVRLVAAGDFEYSRRRPPIRLEIVKQERADG